MMTIYRKGKFILIITSQKLTTSEQSIYPAPRVIIYLSRIEEHDNKVAYIYNL